MFRSEGQAVGIIFQPNIKALKERYYITLFKSLGNSFIFRLLQLPLRDLRDNSMYPFVPNVSNVPNVSFCIKKRTLFLSLDKKGIHERSHLKEARKRFS
jgi:hypothetical protein